MNNSSDNRIRLRVLGLSYSQIQSGAYALILAQVGGPYRIPIVIGASEAQSIALRMEGITPPRPLTHDLFVSFAHAFGVKLLSVFIYKFEDGIFSSELTFSDGERDIVIDSRTSDAIAIAMRTHAPIFTTPEILDETGFIMEDASGKPIGDEDDASDDDDEEYEDEPFCDGGGEDFDDEIYAEDNSYNASPRVENFTIGQLEETLARLIENENYEEAARVNEILKRKRDNK